MPQGSIKCQNKLFLSEDTFNLFLSEDTFNGTVSIFQRVDKWCFKILLCMYCRCAVKFQNFHFMTMGQMKAEKRRSHFSANSVSGTLCTFSRVDSWYSKIRLSMYSRCAVKFAPRGHTKVEQIRPIRSKTTFSFRVW